MINELKKYSTSSKYSYTLGMSLTIEALKGIGDKVVKIYLSKKVHHNEHLDLLIKLANDYGVEIIEDDKLISSLSIKENCYCIGVFEKFKKELVSREHIVLMNYQDEGILGTTLRSAISFDSHDIILINNDVDIFSPRTVRASMGAIFHCNIANYSSIDEYLKNYDGKNLYVLKDHEGEKLKEVSFKSPYSIFISCKDLDIKNAHSIYINHRQDENLSWEIKSTILLHQLFVSKRS